MILLELVIECSIDFVMKYHPEEMNHLFKKFLEREY